jgi:hypothetical protein
MALTKQDIASLAVLAKMTPEDLTKAIADTNEVALTLPDGLSSFTGDEIVTLKKNEHDIGYKKAEKAIPEMLIKKYNTDLGLSFSGKTIDGLIDAVKEKTLTEADKNPDQRVIELNKKIQVLEGNIGKYDTTIAEKDAAMNSLRDSFELGRHVPAPKAEGMQYTPDQIIALSKMSGYEYARNSQGVMVASLNGKEQVDKLGNPLPIGDVVTGFMKAQRIITDEADTTGGRGGLDKKGPAGKVTKMSQLKEKFQAEGKSLQGAEFAQAVEALTFSDKDFDPSA